MTYTATSEKKIIDGFWVDSNCKNGKGPAPVVLILPQWMGITDHEKSRAYELSNQCYNVFIANLYGKDVKPKDTKEAAKLSSYYKNNPDIARRRVAEAMQYATQKAGNFNVSVMGFCFGGTMALELARSGVKIPAIISFHGGLSSPWPVKQAGIIKTPIQVHHGDIDPHVPDSEVDAFIQEMRGAKAQWSLTRYSGAVHAFTQKEAGNDPSTGVAYDAEADRQSWAAALTFLKEKMPNT